MSRIWCAVAFEDGLRLERAVRVAPGLYDESGLWHPGAVTHPSDQLQIATQEGIKHLATAPYGEEHKQQVREQLMHPRYVRSMGGVGLELAVIGNVDTDEVEISFYGWGGNLRHPNAQREATALTYANPDKAYVLVNGPGVGNSDTLSKAAQKEIRQTGSYLPLGEVLAPVIKHVAQDYDTLDVSGHSLGARTATAVVANMAPGSVEELRLHDPTGTREMSLGDLATQFFMREGMDNARYTKAGEEILGLKSAKELGFTQLPLEDPTHIEMAEGAGLTLRQLAADFKRPGMVESLVQQFLVDPSGLKRDAFGDDLLAAAPNVANDIRIIVPSLSRLNDYHDVVSMVAGLRGVAGMTAEAEVWLTQGHTHASMNQPQILTSIYTAKL